MTFTVTRNSQTITATARSMTITFQDDGDLDTIQCVAARPDLDGERQLVQPLSKARAGAILTERGLTGPQRAALIGHLRALIEETFKDRFDDSRQTPETPP